MSGRAWRTWCNRHTCTSRICTSMCSGTGRLTHGRKENAMQSTYHIAVPPANCGCCGYLDSAWCRNGDSLACLVACCSSTITRTSACSGGPTPCKQSLPIMHSSSTHCPSMGKKLLVGPQKLWPRSGLTANRLRQGMRGAGTGVWSPARSWIIKLVSSQHPT